MSSRTSIKNAIIEELKSELTDTNKDKYYTDIDQNVQGKDLYLDQIETFPAITVGLGPERPDYQPGGFRWMFLTLVFRMYVKSEDNAEEKLELLLQDIKTFIDTHEDLNYTITKPDGTSVNKKCTEMTVISIDTDEGLLRPMGLAEVNVQVRYPDRNTRF